MRWTFDDLSGMINEFEKWGASKEAIDQLLDMQWRIEKLSEQRAEEAYEEN